MSRSEKSPFSTASLTNNSAMISTLRPVHARIVAFALPSHSRRFFPVRVKRSLA